MLMMSLSKEECQKLIETGVNPRSGRLLDRSKATYKKLIQECNNNNICHGLKKAACTGDCEWKERKCTLRQTNNKPSSPTKQPKNNLNSPNIPNHVHANNKGKAGSGKRIGRVFVYGRGDVLPPGIVTFNVTSKSKDEWCRALSPFFLGPVEVMPYNDIRFQATRFENAWQYLKVYPQFRDNRDAYLAWASEGFAKDKADRFPMGKGAKPMYSLWDGTQLGYIEARFKIYAPLYAKCLETHESGSLQKMRQVLESGKDIALFDFDGYNYIYNGQSLEQVMYNSKRKLGHAFIIAMILTDQRVWESAYDARKIHAKSMQRSK